MAFTPYKSRLKGCYGFKWRTYSPEQSHLLPYCAGVYVIYFGSKIAYVGSSENLRTRVRSHRFWLFKQAPDPKRITIKAKTSMKFGEWLMLELRLIRRLKPQFNLKGKGCK